MSRLDCQQALAHLQDYLKRELTPELAREIQGISAVPRLFPACPASKQSFLVMLETRAAKETCPKEAARPDRGRDCGRRRDGGRLTGVPLPLAALVSAAVSLVAFGARTLTPSGAAAATIVGSPRCSTAPGGRAARCWPPSLFPAA